MKWIISKDGQVKCVSYVKPDPEAVKELKAAGYKIKEVKDK